MKIHNDKHISITVEDIKDLIIRGLYQEQGVSGIFKVNFEIERQFHSSSNIHDSDYEYALKGAEIWIS